MGMRLWYRRRHRQCGQVALMVLMMTILIFAMVLVTVNIGKVAVLKTTAASATDTAALQMASTLGSMAKGVCSAIRGGHDPHPRLCNKCHAGGWLLNLLIALVVTGFDPLIGIYLQVKAVITDPAFIHVENQRIRRRLPPKVGIKLQAYLTVLASIIDDPRAEPDTHDINQNGNHVELISHFSVWFDDIVSQIEMDIANAMAGKLPQWLNKLTQGRDTVQRLQDFLGTEETATPPNPPTGFFAYLNWVETEFDGRCADFPVDPTDPASPTVHKCRPRIDVPFWKPGIQSGTMCQDGVTCTDCLDAGGDCEVICGINQTGLEDADGNIIALPDFPPGVRPCDEVEFMRVETERFLDFANTVLTLTPDEQKRSISDWVDQLRFYGSIQYEAWEEMISGYPIDQNPPSVPGWEDWLDDLSVGTDMFNAMQDRDFQIPMPPAPTPAPCTILPAVPPDPRPFRMCFALPNAYASMTLTDFVTELSDQASWLNNHELPNVDVPLDPSLFTYSWHDKRGWHHVRAEISDFTLPHPKKEDRSFWDFSICLVGKNVKGTVWAKVTRFDEDRNINKLWTMKQRKNPQGAPPFDPADPDEALGVGMESFSKASYGYKSYSVRLVEGK